MIAGFGALPEQPNADAPEYSWATGASPKVNSIYHRLVALRPETKGHVANRAALHTPASGLTAQTRQALEEVPTPALVMIQGINFDVRCDGTDAENVPLFGEDIKATLQVIKDASPKVRIFIVGQQGRPLDAAENAAAGLVDPAAEEAPVTSGMCKTLTKAGKVNKKGVDTLTRIVESYEAEQARVCATFTGCTTDKGVVAKAPADPKDVVNGHLSWRGQARAAALLWPGVEALMQ
jgi:hypothetical protein